MVGTIIIQSELGIKDREVEIEFVVSLNEGVGW
jgi:hypothetical protein